MKKTASQPSEPVAVLVHESQYTGEQPVYSSAQRGAPIQNIPEGPAPYGSFPNYPPVHPAHPVHAAANTAFDAANNQYVSSAIAATNEETQLLLPSAPPAADGNSETEDDLYAENKLENNRTQCVYWWLAQVIVPVCVPILISGGLITALHLTGGLCCEDRGGPVSLMGDDVGELGGTKADKLALGPGGELVRDEILKDPVCDLDIDEPWKRFESIKRRMRAKTAVVSNRDVAKLVKIAYDKDPQAFVDQCFYSRIIDYEQTRPLLRDYTGDLEDFITGFNTRLLGHDADLETFRATLQGRVDKSNLNKYAEALQKDIEHAIDARPFSTKRFPALVFYLRNDSENFLSDFHEDSGEPGETKADSGELGETRADSGELGETKADDFENSLSDLHDEQGSSGAKNLETSESVSKEKDSTKLPWWQFLMGTQPRDADKRMEEDAKNGAATALDENTTPDAGKNSAGEGAGWWQKLWKKIRPREGTSSPDTKRNTSTRSRGPFSKMFSKMFSKFSTSAMAATKPSDAQMEKLRLAYDSNPEKWLQLFLYKGYPYKSLPETLVRVQRRGERKSLRRGLYGDKIFHPYEIVDAAQENKKEQMLGKFKDSVSMLWRSYLGDCVRDLQKEKLRKVHNNHEAKFPYGTSRAALFLEDFVSPACPAAVKHAQDQSNPVTHPLDYWMMYEEVPDEAIERLGPPYLRFIPPTWYNFQNAENGGEVTTGEDKWNAFVEADFKMSPGEGEERCGQFKDIFVSDEKEIKKRDEKAKQQDEKLNRRLKKAEKQQMAAEKAAEVAASKKEKERVAAEKAAEAAARKKEENELLQKEKQKTTAEARKVAQEQREQRRATRKKAWDYQTADMMDRFGKTLGNHDRGRTKLVSCSGCFFVLFASMFALCAANATMWSADLGARHLESPKEGVFFGFFAVCVTCCSLLRCSEVCWRCIPSRVGEDGKESTFRKGLDGAFCVVFFNMCIGTLVGAGGICYYLSHHSWATGPVWEAEKNCAGCL